MGQFYRSGRNNSKIFRRTARVFASDVEAAIMIVASTGPSEAGIPSGAKCYLTAPPFYEVLLRTGARPLAGGAYTVPKGEMP